jgi:predicted glycosyl hydrolase (DUF1957 family)
MNVKVAFLLNLYQPLTQSRDVFEDIFGSCYAPLLKLIKHKTSAKFTLNTPLSLLQQMDNYGHHSWMEQLSELYNLGRVELTGSAAYHPLITKVPKKVAEQQIILNEYGMGYYLGRHTGFEGEPSLMLKNISGFFPPELALNVNVLHILNELGYKWVATDESAVGNDSGIYSVQGLDTALYVRNRELSERITLKRDSSTDGVTELIEDHGEYLVVLNSEVFGYHNKEGILLLESLIDYITSHGGEILTVDELAHISTHEHTISESDIKESTWAVKADGTDGINPYPYWEVRDSKIHEELWQKFHKACDEIVLLEDSSSYGEEMATLPVWKNFPNDKVRRLLKLHQSLSSDQFFWSSDQLSADGTTLTNKNIVDRSMTMYKEVFNSEL